MSTSRDFHLGDILSVTTEMLVAPRGIDAMCDLLGFMTGANLFTHQLPRAAKECAAVLLEQHPGLRSAVAPDESAPAAVFDSWLAEMVAEHGELLAVTPLPAGAHTAVDPLAELRAMAPQTPVIVVGLPKEASR